VGLLTAQPEPVADGVWRIRGGFPRRNVAAYLIAGEDGVTAYDAGLRGMGGPLRAAAAGHGGLARIVLSHAHPDHRGGAPAARAPVFCHPAERADAERAGVPAYWDFARLPTRAARLRTPALMRAADGGPVEVAGTLGEGDEVAGFRVVHLPGHAPGLIALWRESDRLALCSDAFTTHGGLALPKGAYTLDLAQASESLGKLAALEPAAAWPAHGPPLRGDVRAALAALG
jgi:glyoxylase-like metal-dependent hydrolase (beta-lactamase superfamily II)